MTHDLLPFDLAARRAETAPGTSLGAVADGLTRELAPWLETPLPIPHAKARLTRRGGRCARHGVLLDFDPSSPLQHRCSHCDAVYEAPEHHDWWAMGAQLFTAERTVHAAALHLLRGAPAHRALAVRTLQAIADRYEHWPNRDNVLGPSRPFFSTYLESIWLLNLCHALALLELGGVSDVSEVLRARVLAPSSTLVASYHEGRSNRQVWNEVAVLSAWTLLGEHRRVHDRLDGTGSLTTLLRDGLLDDGTWYEGENYHQFAHRGLWYGLQLLETLGRPVSVDLRRRFHAGFVTPFAGLLPDDTLPARRDAPYAVSIRQWRWAEWCELGYAFTPDDRLAGILHRLYDGTGAAGETGRAVSTADAERNRPAVVLTRADVSWRALLMATSTPVPGGTWTPASCVQPHQGLAVLRRDQGRVYVALEGGVSGGGHGHPDRLALTLQQRDHRWLDDPGTGSYVDRTLHWYRSTLAHHAPLVNGASQPAGCATLTAFEDRGGAGWIQKVSELASGVRATRSVVVCDGYLVDMLEWSATTAVTLTLPVAAGAAVENAAWRPSTRAGAGGLEDGFDFLAQVEELVNAPAMVAIGPHDVPHVGGEAARAWYATTGEARWWQARAPGAPGGAGSTRSRLFVDLHGMAGRIVGVWTWGRADEPLPVADVALTPTGPTFAAVTTCDGTVATHEPAPHGWHIALHARHARSSIDLERLAEPERVTERTTAPVSRTAVSEGLAVPSLRSRRDVADRGVQFRLAAEHYRPTEEPWAGLNTPTADVAIGLVDQHLVLSVSVRTGHPPVVPGGGSASLMPENPLDNERADVNADGLQCYLGAPGDPVGIWRAAVLAVPLPGDQARVTTLVPGGPVPAVEAVGRPDGWSMHLVWRRAELPAGALTIDVIVNERPAARERRRGQLILSGGGGFGYLRGDRHDPVAPLTLRVD